MSNGTQFPVQHGKNTRLDVSRWVGRKRRRRMCGKGEKKRCVRREREDASGRSK